MDAHRQCLSQTLRAVTVVAIALGIFTDIRCNNGIAPEAANSITAKPHGISGTVYFRNWPPRDSVVDLRLVAFTTYPPGDIVSEVLNGRAKYTNTLPYGVDSTTYMLSLAPIAPGTIPFVAVGQQYGSDIMHDWFMVGVYYAGGDTTHPGSINVPADSIVPGIDIRVDFKNPLRLP